MRIRLKKAPVGRLFLFIALGMPALAQPCSLNATNMAFGAINPLNSVDYDSTASIDVTCPDPTSYTLSLSTGSGSYDQRQMVSGSETLHYNLYTDAARNEVWGDGSGVSVTVNGETDSSGNSHTVYGHSPHQPLAVPGNYSDSITVTVTY